MLPGLLKLNRFSNQIIGDPKIYEQWSNLRIWTVFSVSISSKVLSLGPRSPVWESIHLLFSTSLIIIGFNPDLKFPNLYFLFSFWLFFFSLNSSFIPRSFFHKNAAKIIWVFWWAWNTWSQKNRSKKNNVLRFFH